MKPHFKIGDLVYVEGAGVPKRDAGPQWLVNREGIVSLALILKIHTKANPKEIFYKLHLMEKNKEEWISGAYLQPAS
tara:strand:- start:490 stop:720 length:231 start_codon:yes stop_codon:yes gene_type:complete